GRNRAQAGRPRDGRPEPPRYGHSLLGADALRRRIGGRFQVNMLLALSLALIVGLFFSRIISLIHMPNLTAYLVGGLLVGPSVLGLLPQDAVASLSVLTDVALGFIAYSIGAEFRLSYLRQIGSKPIVITLFEGLCAVALVDVALIAMGFPLPLC